MLEVIYQDQEICVIDKPHGYVVHKTRGAGDSPVILQTLRDQIDKKIYPVHRLDRSTSGVMVFALSSKGASLLQNALQSDSATKKYKALCLGHLDSTGHIHRPLNNEKKNKQEAHTIYRVLKEFDKYSLIELELKTGRKNQIRRHLSFEGHHIIGDVNFGKGWLNREFRENYHFHRLFLHCHHLSFIHPFTDDLKVFNANLPEELEELLKKLS